MLVALLAKVLGIMWVYANRARKVFRVLLAELYSGFRARYVSSGDNHVAYARGYGSGNNIIHILCKALAGQVNAYID